MKPLRHLPVLLLICCFVYAAVQAPLLVMGIVCLLLGQAGLCVLVAGVAFTAGQRAEQQTQRAKFVAEVVDWSTAARRVRARTQPWPAVVDDRQRLKSN